MYKDKDKQKQAQREAAKRYRIRQGMTEGMTIEGMTEQGMTRLKGVAQASDPDTQAIWDRWDNKGTPSGALLCLILSASARQQQSSQDYYKFYDNYNIKLLGELFDGKTEELSGGGCARWAIEFDIRGWTPEQIDAKIEEVLKWHCREIERIRGIRSTSS